MLLAHPAVQAAFVTGFADAVHDEVLAAVIVPKPGATLSEREVAEHCRKSLAAYKVARLIRFAAEEELPLTTLSNNAALPARKGADAARGASVLPRRAAITLPRDDGHHDSMRQSA